VLLDLITIDFVNLSEEVTTSAFRFYAVLGMMAAVLLQMGLVGLYLRQAEKSGTPGLVGFLGSFIGTALVVGAFWAQTFGATTLAESAPEVLAEPLSSGWLGPGFILSFTLFAFGWVTFGVATFATFWEIERERWAALLLTFGAALSLFPLPYTEVLFAVAVIWLGINSLRWKPEDGS
jgi:hypothetical protein